jgi:outer membrane immunogenic protein
VVNPLENYSGAQSVERRFDLFGTVRARLGALVTPSLLAYATGGLAYADVHVGGSVSAQESVGLPFYPPVFGGDITSQTRAGWTAGGGFEWLFAPHWSAKAEYLYYDLGTIDGNYTLTQINLTAPLTPVWATAAVHTSTRLNGNIARLGVNYHF